MWLSKSNLNEMDIKRVTAVIAANPEQFIDFVCWTANTLSEMLQNQIPMLII